VINVGFIYFSGDEVMLPVNDRPETAEADLNRPETAVADLNRPETAVADFNLHLDCTP
jgi:hypothetical protein